MRSLRVFILGVLAMVALSVAPALAADPVFPVNSRIGLVPPPGFVPSVKFPGFENQAASAAILLVDLPPEAFADIEKGFTDEALKARGMTVQAREQIALKDGHGFMVAGPQESGGAKRYEAVLIASVGGATAIVSVQMVEASRATVTDAAIRDALKTVTLRKEVPQSERLSVLPYKIGDLAGFRIIRSGQDGNAILTDGPNDAVEAVEQPFMVIGVQTGDVPKPEERDQFARRIFSTAPGIKDVKIVRAEPLRMGQSAGYEIVAEAKNAATDTDVTTVQWLRFGQYGHLQMFAIVRRAAWNDVYPRLRAIRDSIEVR